MCLAIDSTVCFLLKTGPCQPTVIQPGAGVELPPYLEKAERTDRQGVCRVEVTVIQAGHEYLANNSGFLNRSPSPAGEIGESATQTMRHRDGSKMDPVMTDRCVKMALSDAFSRFQNYRIPPTPFAFARRGLPCHFKRSGRDEWAHYTNTEYGCHREFSPNRGWFWRSGPLRQWLLVASPERIPVHIVASAAANPRNSAQPVPFPVETVFADDKFKGDGKFCD